MALASLNKPLPLFNLKNFPKFFLISESVLSQKIYFRNVSPFVSGGLTRYSEGGGPTQVGWALMGGPPPVGGAGGHSLVYNDLVV
jgi:hypothetical protein